MPLALIAPWLAGRGRPGGGSGGWAWGLFGLQLVVFSGMRLEFEGRSSPFTGRYFFWFAGPAVVMAVSALAGLAARGRAARGLAVALVGGAARAVRVGLGGDPALAPEGDLEHRLRPDPADARRGRHRRPGDRLEPAADHRLVLRPPSISLPADPEELARLNRDSPTPADYLLVDMNYNCIASTPPGAPGLARPGPPPRPWEGGLLVDYEFVLPPDLTRPIGYVFLRRRTVPASPLETQIRRQQGRQPSGFPGTRG